MPQRLGSGATKKGRTSPRDRRSSRNLCQRPSKYGPKCHGCHSKNPKNLQNMHQNAFQNASKCIKMHQNASKSFDHSIWWRNSESWLVGQWASRWDLVTFTVAQHCTDARPQATRRTSSRIVAQSHPGFDDNFPSENFACPHPAFSWYYRFLRGFALPWLNRGMKRLLLRCYPGFEVWVLIVSLSRLSAAVKSGHASNATPLQS